MSGLIIDKTLILFYFSNTEYWIQFIEMWTAKF